MKKIIISLIITILLFSNISLIFADNEDDVPRIFSVDTIEQ